MAQSIKQTKAEWRALDDFRRHWHAFCDCDPFEGSDTFVERMEASGLIKLRRVTRHDLESAFADERGIVRGGYVWDTTCEGRAALEGEGRADA